MSQQSNLITLHIGNYFNVTEQQVRARYTQGGTPVELGCWVPSLMLYTDASALLSSDPRIRAKVDLAWADEGERVHPRPEAPEGRL